MGQTQQQKTRCSELTGGECDQGGDRLCLAKHDVDAKRKEESRMLPILSACAKEDEEMDESKLEAKDEEVAEPEPVAVSKHSKFDPRVFSSLDLPMTPRNHFWFVQ